MELYLTKEKLVYDGSHDLYIGKIGRKKIYCLNDVCRILGIFFRDTKKNVADKGKYIVGVMIKRKKRYMENTFIDYDGIIEVLLMARYDKSVTFKKWVDSIPETSFKKCQKYVKRYDTYDTNAFRPKAITTRSHANKSISLKSTLHDEKSNPLKVEAKIDEINKSSKIKSSLIDFVDDVDNFPIWKNKYTTEEYKVNFNEDIILSLCKKEHYSIELFISLLEHLNFATRIAYLQNKEIDFGKAIKNLEWIEDLISALKKKYMNTPYFKNSPMLVLNKQKLAKMK